MSSSVTATDEEPKSQVDHEGSDEGEDLEEDGSLVRQDGDEDSGEDEDDEDGKQELEWSPKAALTLQVLKEALAEQQPHLPQLTHANASSTCAHVTSLSLQFKGLGSLDFLWMFKSLTCLELSNNCLSEIQGLEALTSLTWLDLSFNQISSLSGLGQLNQLEVLALHNNLVDHVDRSALHQLPHLQLLTLASNKIKRLSEVLVLRVARELCSLSLANNPVCEGESGRHYPHYVIAHLPRLAYLDHRRIDPEVRTQASEVYRKEVAVVESKEEREQEQEDQADQARRSREEHRQAGVLALNDGSLFTRMFTGDENMEVLLKLPGAHTLMTKYRDQFNTVCLRVFNAGLTHEVERQKELELLHAALDAAKKDAVTHARGMVRNLEAEVSKMVATAREIRTAEEASLGEDQDAHETRLAKSAALQEEFNNLLSSTSHDLLSGEVILADQIKDVVGRAHEELGALVGNFLEEAAKDLQEGRRLAYTFYCRLRELTAKMGESGGEGSSGTTKTGGDESEDEDGVSTETEDRTAQVFEGSDTLTAALAGIHDRHLALIDAREEELKQHLHDWLSQTLQNITKVEWARHRSCVDEITTLTARQHKMLQDALPELQQ